MNHYYKQAKTLIYRVNFKKPKSYVYMSVVSPLFDYIKRILCWSFTFDRHFFCLNLKMWLYKYL